MDKTAFLMALQNGKIEYVLNEPMHRHTTFKIGGAADILISIKSADELSYVLKSANQHGVPTFLLGKGSNLLVSDKGIEGAVIMLSGLDKISIQGNTVICEGGATLRSVCIAAQKAGLAGLEFAFGIPGSVGGAVYMNAGAYGGEISGVIKSAVVMDKDCNIRKVQVCDMALGYRTSAFKANGEIILSAEFELTPDNDDLIRERMEDYFTRRREKQPLEYPSAGSTFKRPEGYFAGALIEQNNLKGVSVGGAEVSVKHAGFVINKDNAKCQDVLELIKKIQKTVIDNNGVRLEPEVIFIGRE